MVVRVAPCCLPVVARCAWAGIAAHKQSTNSPARYLPMIERRCVMVCLGCSELGLTSMNDLAERLTEALVLPPSATIAKPAISETIAHASPLLSLLPSIGQSAVLVG